LSHLITFTYACIETLATCEGNGKHVEVLKCTAFYLRPPHWIESQVASRYLNVKNADRKLRLGFIFQRPFTRRNF